MKFTTSLYETEQDDIFNASLKHLLHAVGLRGQRTSGRKPYFFFFLLSVRVTFRNVSNPHKKFWEVVTSLYDLKWENCHCCSSSTKSLEEYLMSMNSRKQKSADRLMCSLPSVQSRQEEIHVSGVFPHWYRLLIAALLCKHQIKTQFLPVKKVEAYSKKSSECVYVAEFLLLSLEMDQGGKRTLQRSTLL